MMKHCHNGQFMLDEGEDENVDVMGQNGNGDDGTSDNDGDGDDDDDDDDDDDGVEELTLEDQPGPRAGQTDPVEDLHFGFLVSSPLPAAGGTGHPDQQTSQNIEKISHLVLLPVVSWMQHRGSLHEVAGALCLLQRLDLVQNKIVLKFFFGDNNLINWHLVFKMLVLPLQVLNVTAVTAVLPPHKGDILACLINVLHFT